MIEVSVFFPVTKILVSYFTALEPAEGPHSVKCAAKSDKLELTKQDALGSIKSSNKVHFIVYTSHCINRNVTEV